MNGWDVLIVFFTAFYAFAIGRSVIFWPLMSAFYGFWIPLLDGLSLCQSENQSQLYSRNGLWIGQALNTSTAESRRWKRSSKRHKVIFLNH
jgi:hypothetical protein